MIGEGGRISKSKENIAGEGPLPPFALPGSLGDGLTIMQEVNATSVISELCLLKAKIRPCSFKLKESGI